MKNMIYHLSLLFSLFAFTASAHHTSSDSLNTKKGTIDLQKDIGPAYTGAAFIHRLQNGERFSLQMAMSGCFSSSSYELIISKSNDAYLVHYKDKIKVLNEDQIKALADFEMKVRNIKQIGICTLQYRYTFQYKNEGYTLADLNCNWNGVDMILDQLGIPTNP